MRQIHSAGIDKIVLTTPEFRIREMSDKWSVKPATLKWSKDMPGQPYLDTDMAGNEIRGAKIYANSDKTGAQWNGSRIGNEFRLMVTFNPSKMGHAYTLAGTRSDTFRESIKRITHEAAGMDLVLDISKMNLSRVDIAKQSNMTHPVWQYNDAFRMLDGGKQMTERQYPDGYIFLNTQTEICFYDKVAEMEYLGLSQSIAGETNLMRAEVRSLKTENVGRVLNISTLADLCRMDDDAINQAYTKQMSRKVFKSQTGWTQLTLNLDDEMALLKKCQQEYGRNWVLRYCAMQSDWDAHISQLGGMKRFAEMLEHMGMRRETAWRQTKDLMKMMNMKAAADRTRSTLTPAMLLDELAETFLAA